MLQGMNPREGADVSSANVSRMYRNPTDPQDAVDDEIRHIRDLVFVRNLLAKRGATYAELRDCDTVIDGVRRQLAHSAKRASARYATAA
jgi:hypothetical protein